MGKFRSLKYMIMPTAIIIVVMGSIILGITTPTEASAIGALGSLIAVDFKRQLNMTVIKNSLLESTKMTSIMMWIFMGAMTFGQIYDALWAKELVQSVTTGLL